MKNSWKIWALVMIASWWLGACDSVFMDKDPEPVPPGGVPENLYTLFGRPVVLDLKSLPDVTANTTFRIEQPPQSGEAKFTAAGLLLYTPDSNFVAGEDAFSVSLEGTRRTVRSFRVGMVSDSTRIPCDAGAMADEIVTPFASQPLIEVLRNDRFCTVAVDTSTLAVAEAPRFGRADVEGRRIRYTPQDGFSGVDTFIYRISVTGRETRTYLASVRVRVGERPRDCKITVRDDEAVWMPRFVTDSLVIPVLNNDFEASCRGSAQSVRVTRAPNNGKASIGVGTVLVYKPNEGFIGNDELAYQACYAGVCGTGVVRIRLKAPAADCVLAARDDKRTVDRSRPDADVRQGFVYLPVLDNDQLCQPIRELKITENLTNARLEISQGAVIYRFPQGIVGIVTFKYEITDTAGNRSSATVTVEFK